MLVQQFNNKTLPRQLETLMEHTANISALLVEHVLYLSFYMPPLQGGFSIIGL